MTKLPSRTWRPLLREEDEDDEEIGADVFPCSGGIDGVHGEAAVDDGVAGCFLVR
jgi:hypothetical protein